MMFATPVRRSAWSSTTRTLARTFGSATSEKAVDGTSVSASDIVPGRDREGGRFPGQHHLGARPRRRHDRQGCPDPLGALLHARHPEAAAAMLLRDPTAVVCDREAEPERPHRGGMDGDLARAGMLHR